MRNDAPRPDAWWLWALAFLAVLGFTTLKAIRLPIEYPSTLYLLNYQEGFTKRALFGSVVFAGDGPVKQADVNLIALAIFAVLFTCIAIIGGRMLRQYPDLGLVVLLFGSSISIVYLASTTGYFDHILLLLGILAILPARPGIRLALTFILGAGAILIHEAAALMILPLMYFATLLAMGRAGTDRPLMRLLPAMALHAALTVYVSFFTLLDAPSVATLQSALQARADFELQILAFEVVGKTPGDEMQYTFGSVNLVAHLDSIIIVAPALLPILIVLGDALRHLNPGLAVWALAAAACLAPMLLRFLGTDIHRWDAIAVCTSFLALFVTLQEMPRSYRAGLDRAWITPALVVMIVVSASTTTFLFRDQTVQLYPFFELRAALVELLR